MKSVTIIFGTIWGVIGVSYYFWKIKAKYL
jgi:hypothetical protein